MSDLEQQQLALAVVEGGHTDEHLVDQDAQRPPVDREIVALVHYHLRGQVLRRAAESLRRLAIRESFGEAVVDDLEVAVLIDEHVFKLEVTVHDSLAVQVADSHRNLHGVKRDNGLGQSLSCLEHLVELSAADEGHHEVEPSLRLEQIVHAAEERVVTAKQDILLKLRVLDLVVLDENVLADNLDCVLFFVLRALSQENFSERTATKQRDQLEVRVAQVGSLALADQLDVVFVC